METEMVLLAMLPEDDRVMMVQTPRLRTIADLEQFIVDEYSRVFPFEPALSRNLRIQKCVSPEVVVDRRSYAKARQQTPHSFVDLAKNVQVGNVFQNMEQIYIVLNTKSKKAIVEAARKQQVPQKKQVPQKQQVPKQQVPQKQQVPKQQVPKQQVPQKLPLLAPKVQAKAAAESKKTQQVPKKVPIEAPRKQQPPKKVTAAALNVQARNVVKNNKIAGKEVQDGKKEKEQHVSKKPPVEKKPHDTKQETTADATKDATEKIHDSTNNSNDGKKVAVTKIDEKKVDLKEKSRKAATKEKDDAKKTAKEENKSDSKTPVAKTEENTSKKVLKKVAFKKSENALLKKMRAARHDASQSGAALVVNTLQDTGSGAPKVPLESERKRKSDGEDVSSAQGNTPPDAPEPLAKKKKTVKKSDDKISKPVEDEVAAAKAEKSAKKTTAQDKIPKTIKKKATTTTKSELKTDDDLSTASESTPAKSKSKKNIDIKFDDVDEPVVKRAKTEVLPKASIVKKAAEKEKRVAKPTTPESDSSSSQSSSSSATQGDELASGEKIDVAETPATKKAAMKSNEKPKVTSEQKSGFEKIMADRTKQIADEKKATDAKRTTTFTPEKRSVQTLKSAESTASESSSDSDQPPVFVKVANHSRKNATPVEDSSSSSSEEDEVDYSQNLLADLIKNG